MARQPKHVRSMLKRLKHKSSSKDYHSIELKLRILKYDDNKGKNSAARSMKLEETKFVDGLNIRVNGKQ